MNAKRRFERYLVIAVAVVLFFPSAVQFVTGGDQGGGGGGPTVAGRSTFQRRGDSPSPGPSGTLSLKKSGDKQMVAVDIQDLPGDSFGLFFGFLHTPGTNIIFPIGPLDENPDDRWSMQYNSVGSAHPALPVEDIEDMAGLFLTIATTINSTTNLVDCVTNIVCTTNELMELICTTNLDSCATNIIYPSFLFTQVPRLTSGTGQFNSKGKDSLELPELPPSSKAKGTVQTKFTATQGRSFLCILADGLLGGQVYSLWMSTNVGGSVVTNIGEMVELKRTSRVFKRDTKLGETLPGEVGSVTNLYGFNFEIRDAFDNVYLSGVVPPAPAPPQPD
jgi:hypothetical protein